MSEPRTDLFAASNALKGEKTVTQFWLDKMKAEWQAEAREDGYTSGLLDGEGTARDRFAEARADLAARIEALPMGPGTARTDGTTTTYIGDIWTYRATVLAAIREAPAP